MLKIAYQLRLQELKFYFKYIHKNLPAYLLDWEFISNVNIHFHDTRTSSKIHTVRTKHEFAKKMTEIQLTTYYKRYSCNSGRKDTHTAYEVSQQMQKQFLIQKYTDTCAIQNCYSCNQYHHYKCLFNAWKPYFLVYSLDFIFPLHCIAASALILHLPRTFSYNRFLDDPTQYVIYYY